MSVCRLSEAIKLKDGVLFNMHYHNQRCNMARFELFGAQNGLNLEDYITLSPGFCQGLYKVRITYTSEVESVEIEPYEHKPVRSLKIVECAHISYRYKYRDRTLINELFAQRGDCDDIMIIVNGIISDASSSNLVFNEFGSRLIIPETAMLRGTKTSFLLEQGLAIEEKLTPADLKRFSEVHLVNAMVDLYEKVVPIENVLDPE
ncbi:MAG: aminotransferase class IV [Spirochaetes bacterium]|jgi:4-amino-4-deoxychorismate lyase|nr:aminotransferase class IV [Spirochaetota bacterium]